MTNKITTTFCDRLNTPLKIGDWVAFSQYRSVLGIGQITRFSEKMVEVAEDNLDWDGCMIKSFRYTQNLILVNMDAMLLYQMSK